MVLNTCTVAQTFSLISSGTASNFRVDAGTLTIPPGGALEVPVTFEPQVLGPRTGTLTGTSSSGLISIPLRGLGVVPAEIVDSFTQQARPKADLLFVVSDGPGMLPVQQWLGSGSQTFLQFATTSQLDFRVGVARGRTDGGSPTVLTPQTWQQGFLLGDTGASTSSCLSRSWQLLSADAGWLRPDAMLGLICVQNTEEQLTGAPAPWVRLLQRAAGRARNELTISALANFTPACPAPDDSVLATAAAMTRGTTQSVCALDGGSLEALGKAGYRTTWFLTRPGPEDGGVEVAIDGMPLPGAGVWRFDAALDAVIFEPLFAPEPGKTLTVRYRSACAP